MKKLFTLIISCAFAAAYAQDGPQITNGDFEDWSNVTDKNHAPAQWNSFETASGTYAFLVGQQQVAQSSDVRPGSTGKSSVRIYASKVLGIVNAQGNLTTGRINAGGMSATDAQNHNYSDINDELYSCKLGALPDSIVFWAKFIPKDKSYNARLAATVHDSYNYITYGTAEADATDATNASHVVAKAQLNFTTSVVAEGNAQWVRYAVPFITEGFNATSPDYIIVNISTNSLPGQGSDVDELYIDDIELVYPTKRDFTDNLVVTINGVSSNPMPSTINVTESKGKYTLSLKNFTLVSEETVMPIGNITLTDVEGVQLEDGSIALKTNQNIVIENGDDPNVDMWLGPIITSQVGSIPVSLDAVMNDKLRADIGIDLTSSALGQNINVTFGADADGIRGISTAAKPGVVYNLAGQAVDDGYRGIVIVNGRKVIR